MKVKQCPSCKMELDINDFYKSKQKKSGRRSYCKQCEKEKNNAREPQYKLTRKRYRQTDKYKEIKRLYYKNNKKIILSNNREWRQSKKGRLYLYKMGAKSRNIEQLLSDNEFYKLQQLPCAYCGSDIDTIGIDRINNNLPYEPNNIIPCCTTCNIMKKDLSREGFLNHIKRIYQYATN